MSHSFPPSLHHSLTHSLSCPSAHAHTHSPHLRTYHITQRRTLRRTTLRTRWLRSSGWAATRLRRQRRMRTRGWESLTNSPTQSHVTPSLARSLTHSIHPPKYLPQRRTLRRTTLRTRWLRSSGWAATRLPLRRMRTRGRGRLCRKRAGPNSCSSRQARSRRGRWWRRGRGTRASWDSTESGSVPSGKQGGRERDEGILGGWLRVPPLSPLPLPLPPSPMEEGRKGGEVWKG